VVQVIALTSTLTDTSEYGETTVGLGNVVDKFLNQHGLTDTGTTEKTNLTTTGVWSNQVNNFDTRLENFSICRLLNEGRGVTVNRAVRVRLNGTTLVNGLTNDVQDTAQRTITDRDSDGGTSVQDLLATHQTLSTVHGNATDSVLTKVLGDLKNEAATVLHVLDLQGVENGWELLTREVNVNNGTDNGADVANLASTRGGLSRKTTS